jgi:acylphosphatase
MIRKHVYISGRVQGVYFRQNTLEKADSLGIKGWVRNIPDGRVEAVFEGSEKTVRQIIEWCRTGDPPARVDKVEVYDEPEGTPFDSFRIVG